MTKYLQNIISRFEELKVGIIKNNDKWKTIPESVEKIDQHIKEVKIKDKEIEKVKKLLSSKQAEARRLKDQKKDKIEIIEKRAIGLHADETERLEEYKIKLK